MLKSLTALSLTLAAAAACMLPASAQMMRASSMDAAFLKKAIVAGEQEVADAKMETSSSNRSVQYFANRMIHDHSLANGQLIALARKEGVAVPPAPNPGPAMSAQAYMQHQVTDHEQAVALFQKEAADGSGAAKSLAMKTLPVLKQHLAMAKQFVQSGTITPRPDLM